MPSSWKQQLIELESLTKSNGEAAWKTAILIREIWKNEAFQKDAGGYETAQNRLQKFAGRFALSVSDMIQMIEHFPKIDDWKSGQLDIVRDKTCKAIAAKLKRPMNAEKPSRIHITRREYDAMKEKLEAALARVRELQKENRELRRKLATGHTGKTARKRQRERVAAAA